METSFFFEIEYATLTSNPRKTLAKRNGLSDIHLQPFVPGAPHWWQPIEAAPDRDLLWVPLEPPSSHCFGQANHNGHKSLPLQPQQGGAKLPPGPGVPHWWHSAEVAPYGHTH